MAAGYSADADPFDGVVNINVSAWLLYQAAAVAGPLGVQVTALQCFLYVTASTALLFSSGAPKVKGGGEWLSRSVPRP